MGSAREQLSCGTNKPARQIESNKERKKKDLLNSIHAVSIELNQ
jgi:hypothetical protein